MSYPGYDMFDYDYVAPKDRVENLPEGQYPFRIHQVIPKVSKSSGNNMLEVLCKVTDHTGREWQIYEYLIAPKPYNKDQFDSESYEAKNYEANLKRLNTKIGNIAKAIGRPDIDASGYDKKKLVSDLLGSGGQCYVKVQEDKNGQYPDKNVISKWIANVDPEAAAKDVKQLDDEIPW